MVPWYASAPNLWSHENEERALCCSPCRITVDPAVMDGMACVRGLRIPVATVVAMVADGMTANEILGAYPDLESDDIREALQYATEAVPERSVPLVLPA
ncbi:MAG TPA: DUF433 domain-containing protein [Gemmatimonadales bacterium]|nr:DUF433 domain-containing protein [Gemmatimonadales bacterium]